MLRDNKSLYFNSNGNLSCWRQHFPMFLAINYWQICYYFVIIIKFSSSEIKITCIRVHLKILVLAAFIRYIIWLRCIVSRDSTRIYLCIFVPSASLSRISCIRVKLLYVKLVCRFNELNRFLRYEYKLSW